LHVVDLAHEPDFTIGAIQVGPALREVKCGSQVQSVEPRVMQVLVELVRNRGRVVSRQDLIDACWGGRVVGDEAVNRCIAAIRRVSETFGGFSVTTIARVGYKLEEVPMALAQAAEEPQQPTQRPDPPHIAHGGTDPFPHKPGLMRVPTVMVALGGAVAALVVAGISVAWSGLAPPAPQLMDRTAFFGFQEDGADPTLAMVAKASTDQTFQTLGALRLSTVARAETLGAVAPRRLDKAREFGARYVLSGEIRREDAVVKLWVRIEDASTRATVWEHGLEAAASDATLLPARAANAIGSTLRCIVRGRSQLTQDTEALVKQVADLCRIGSYSDLSDRFVTGSRALAEAQPGSAHFQSMLAIALLTTVDAVPEAARLARIEEAKEVMTRAKGLDSTGTAEILPRIFMAFVQRQTLPELEPMLLEALAATEGSDAFLYSQVNLFYGAALTTAGRMRESEAHQSLALANDPLQSPARLAYAQAVQGKVAPAQEGLAQEFARFPSAWAWEDRMNAAVFLGVGDAETVLTSRPSAVSTDTVQCWGEILKAQATSAKGPHRTAALSARNCAARGYLSEITAVAALASLGDLDAAFDAARGQTLVVTLAERNPLESLYWPSSRAMRADPRFLQLARDVGLLDYWMLPGHAPDFCQTERVPVCTLLLPQLSRP
jgi:DNA-binding winged helix-turn-helix (wHTH) protein/TolB-like protein